MGWAAGGDTKQGRSTYQYQSKQDDVASALVNPAPNTVALVHARMRLVLKLEDAPKAPSYHTQRLVRCNGLN